MPEIKFRAERLDDGEEVFGYYIQYKPEPFMGDNKDNAYEAILEERTMDIAKFIPGTLSLWTGETYTLWSDCGNIGTGNKKLRELVERFVSANSQSALCEIISDATCVLKGGG